MKISTIPRRFKPAVVAALLVGCGFAMLSTDARGQFAAEPHPQNLIAWLNFMPANCETRECLRSYRLKDGDVITLKIENEVVRHDQIEIVFRSGLNVTWWKELAIAGATPDAKAPYDAIEKLSTEGDEHGPRSFILRLNLAQRMMLVFSKAKTLGVHTEMYRFYPKLQGIPPQERPARDWRVRADEYDISRMGGARLTFVWEKD